MAMVPVLPHHQIPLAGDFPEGTASAALSLLQICNKCLNLAHWNAASSTYKFPVPQVATLISHLPRLAAGCVSSTLSSPFPKWDCLAEQEAVTSISVHVAGRACASVTWDVVPQHSWLMAG